MSLISKTTKYLDSPGFIAKVEKSCPTVLLSGATCYGLYNVYKTPKDKDKALIKNFSILSLTVLSTLFASKKLKLENAKGLYGIAKLSLLGLIPVLGGITGGIIGDRLTIKDWKKGIPEKIKEGLYQYLANIFLCNVGAGAALTIAEKFNIKSRIHKAGLMFGGIILTGVAGGSAIANYIGKKIIDPLFCQGNKRGNNNNIYRERTPEILDIGLHVDDVATVGVISGLKWIEPALPILYSISGYRAGIGYRNGTCPNKKNFDIKDDHRIKKQHSFNGLSPENKRIYKNFIG